MNGVVVLNAVIRVLVLAVAVSIAGYGCDIGPEGTVYREDVSRAKKDLMGIAAGLEGYHAEHGHYPVSPRLRDSGSTITLRGTLSGAVKSTKYNQVPDEILVALHRGLEKIRVDDRFASWEPTQYFYYSTGATYLLSSAGPDLAIDTLAVIDGLNQLEKLGELVAENSYDPTNGLVSAGDIILYGQSGNAVEPKWK